MPLDTERLSLTLTRYNEPDWLVDAALTSLAQQRDVQAEILILDQVRSRFISERCAALSSAMIDVKYINIPEKGLSFARNEAIRLAQHDHLLYLDADAIAEPGWAHALSIALNQKDVAVVGSRIRPQWHGTPLLLCKSGLVMDQYSLYDLGFGRRAVDRVVGAGFGIHRKRLGSEAYFDASLGRAEGDLSVGEETDLCHRARRRGLKILYEGRVSVIHQILPERLSYSWLWRRFYFAGINRARSGGQPRSSTPLAFWDYVALPIVLPSYLLGYLRETVR
jgi:glycosyltransferase involved in cell wall biosynthesis